MQSRYTRFLLSSALTCLAASTGWAQVNDYSQDFEGLDISNPDALGDDGWLVGANVFDSSGNYLYNYFAFPAPNGGPAFSAIVADGQGPEQGAQSVVTYNDYNNGQHGDGSGNRIEANFFREEVIAASDVGKTMVFSFDGAYRDLVGSTTAAAFIKVLDPNNGWSVSEYQSVDTTNLTVSWETFTLSTEIRADQVGHIFQIGFMNTASWWEGSGVQYDNISLSEQVLPDVTSGTLAAHFLCDPATMDLDANNAVTAWRARNNSSIELTASGSGDATNILYDASDLNGQGGIRVNDFTSETMGLSGSIGDLDLVESTIFWLGYYAPGRDGSTDDGSGQYAYNYYNGSSYISHQSDDGIVEHYSPTRAGDAIDVLEGDYQVWTSVTYGASPGTSMYVNGIDLNVAPHDGIASDPAADTFHMFRYSSSGYNFVGNMHECIIYEGALSAEDIAAVEAYLDAKRAAYDGLPEVSSGALAAHFVADPSTMDIDPANNAVTAWRASNNLAINLTASGTGAATNLLYDAGDLNGHGAIQVNDFTSETMGLSGSIGDLDLVESTIFWLGYYAPGRDGSTDDGSGQYAYNYYNGGSYISHQSDDGVVEHYSPTRAGDAIDALEGDHQVWTSVTYGSSPGTSMYVNGVDLNVAPHDGILSDGSVADTFQMFRYSSSGYNFVGNMHECIIYEGALSAADIATVEAYLDAKRTPPGPGTAYCFGDGTACPCGNAGSGSDGCGNSTGPGGRLTASGDPSLSNDTIVLAAANLVPGQPCLFFSGANQVNGGAGITFGDGLRCAGSEAVRIEVTTADSSGNAATSGEVSTNGQAYGHVIEGGETVNYQGWYRDDVAVSPCGNSFNLTNGYTLTWSS